MGISDRTKNNRIFGSPEGLTLHNMYICSNVIQYVNCGDAGWATKCFKFDRLHDGNNQLR